MAAQDSTKSAPSEPTSFIDMMGTVSGLLEVIGKAPIDPSKPSKGACWIARCHGCGSVRPYRGVDLRRKRAKSCGCSTKAIISESRRRHGGTGTPEYETWRGMIDRCEKSSHASYSRYGAKGITVCSEWRHDFPAFLRDVGPKPSPEHTLERIQNRRGYEPGNVRWATKKEQARNRSSNRLIEFRSETKTLIEWAELTGIESSIISRRIEWGWSIEEAMTRPVASKKRPFMNKKLAYRGREMTPVQWARELGMRLPTLCRRLSAGWDMEKIVNTKVRN
jgi:hypothetical protein